MSNAPRAEIPPYSIELHCHHFAAWAAARAASVKGCRFSVAEGRDLLERCGFGAQMGVEDLPEPKDMDASHAKWRAAICCQPAPKGIQMTHGIAAKLINVYLKARFVHPPDHLHLKVFALHPPIDRLMLDAMAKADFGGNVELWRKTSRRGWSKLDGTEYQEVIAAIRRGLGKKPMWMIEEFWRGYQ